MIQIVMFVALWNPIIPPPVTLTFDSIDQPAPIAGSGHAT